MKWIADETLKFRYFRPFEDYLVRRVNQFAAEK